MKEGDKKGFPIKGWKWIFYVIGLITGVFNLLFWAIQYGSYRSNDYGILFLGKTFTTLHSIGGF